MSFSPECAKQHDRETASIKTILTLAAVGSVGIHGLAWAISAVLPTPVKASVTAQKNAPIELLLVSEPEEERVEPEDPLDLEDPAQPLKPELKSELENFERVENTTASSSDFLTAAAQLAPEPPAVPQPSLSLPQELAVAPPAPEPTLLFEPEPESLDLEAAIAPAPEFSEPDPLEPEPQLQPEETVEASEWDDLETAEEITEVVEEPQAEESQEVADTSKDATETLATKPETTAAPEPDETKSPPVNSSLLDKIKDLRARARRDRPDQRTAAANRGSDRSTGSSTATAERTTASAAATAGPNRPRTGQASGSPAESRDLASAGHNESNPKPVAEAGSQQSRGDLIAAREPSSQNEEQSNRPARQTIACRRCSKPKFSQRELAGAEGETQFEVITDARGRVVDVRVTQSSGSSAVDEKTVAHIKRRWRFESTSGGATIPVTVDMAVEGSDYYRERKEANPQERLEYETQAQPAPIANDSPIPTAVKEPQLASPHIQITDAPLETTHDPDSPPEASVSPAPLQSADDDAKAELEQTVSPAPEPFIAPSLHRSSWDAPAPAYEPAPSEPEQFYEPAPVYEPEPVYEPAPTEALEPAYQPEPYPEPQPIYEAFSQEPAPVIEESYLEE